MKKRISSNIALARFIFAPVAIISFYLLIQEFTTKADPDDITLKLYFSIFFASSLFFYYYERRENIEFDKKYVYITKARQKKRIDFKRIKKIQVSNIKINNKTTWKIEYIDYDEKKRHVRFIPNRRNPELFDEFKEQTKAINPEVLIEEVPKSF